MTLFLDRRDVANLAYWVTGTEGSNPSLSASFIDLFRFESSFCDPVSMPVSGRAGGHRVSTI